MLSIKKFIYWVKYIIKVSKNFNSELYLRQNPDVKASGMSPLAHYFRFGKKEGRTLNTENNNTDDLNESYIKLIRNSDLFDIAYYLQNNPDITELNIDAVSHYLYHGGFEGRKPSEGFDSAFYLEKNPDVYENKINPLIHFILYGKAEGRKPLPDTEKKVSSYFKEKAEQEKLNSNKEFLKYIDDLLLMKKSTYFDASYYLSKYPDLKSTGIDPAEHYFFEGWKEGKNPSAFFNTNFYLNKYNDIKQGNINPLLHYIKFGESENRHCSKKFEKNYLLWIKKYDTLSLSDIDEINKDILSFESKPKISIILPVFNPNHEWLKEAINSVINQIYPNWELCIADDCSTDTEIKKILEYYSQNDSRIKVIYRPINGHISLASNSALELVTGDFIALLDHDDIIPIHALYWVAKTILNIPDIKLIYSDEDKIDVNGIRQNPYFKCDWNPELFYSQNLISHLGVYQTALIKKIGGFREDYEGSQDYDLALRFIELISPKEIFHIPKILYHWRVSNNSTSSSMENKNYAKTSAIKAINDYFVRNKKNAIADIIRPGLYRVKFKMPESIPHVTIIIPTKNQVTLLRTCIMSILNKTIYPTYDIVIIDNNSDENALFQFFEEIKYDKRISILTDDQTFNYSSLNNKAVSIAKGEFVCLLNNDTEIINNEWLNEMLAVAVQEDVGAVGAKLYYPDGKIQHAGVVLGMGGYASHAHQYCGRYELGYFGRAILLQEMSAVTGACLLVSKAKYKEVNGLDEINLPIEFNDVDFCLRLQEAGYRNIWTPFAELYHYESASRKNLISNFKSQSSSDEKKYFKNRWGNTLLFDPFYNPNLSLSSCNFNLAFPPRLSILEINFPNRKL